MNRTKRLLTSALAVGLALTACGGDGGAELRAEVTQMLERLGRGPNLAECIAERFDGKYAAADFQPMIEARGDLSAVNFQLTEDLVLAERACLEDA